MPIIAGQRLWRIKKITVHAGETLAVPHDLAVPGGPYAIKPEEILVIPVPPIPPDNIGWSALQITQVTIDSVYFKNTLSEGDVKINVLFLLPHTMIGPGDNDGYASPTVQI
jgi:hypothetical protein